MVTPTESGRSSPRPPTIKINGSGDEPAPAPAGTSTPIPTVEGAASASQESRRSSSVDRGRGAIRGLSTPPTSSPLIPSPPHSPRARSRSPARSPLANTSILAESDERGRPQRRRRKGRGTFSIGADSDTEREARVQHQLVDSEKGGTEKKDVTIDPIANANKNGNPTPGCLTDPRARHGHGHHREKTPHVAFAGGEKMFGSGSGSGGIDSDDEDDERDKGKTKDNASFPTKVKRGVLGMWDRKVVSWVKPKLKWEFLKPVIRISVSIWLGFVIVLIGPAGHAMGLASFFVLIVSCMIPPAQSFVQVVEILFNTLFYTSIAWAWTCIAIAIAHTTRVPTSPESIQAAAEQHGLSGATLINKLALDGFFIQAKPSIVCSVFLSFGTGMLLWWKIRTQPSPATFPLVLACIVIDISLTTAPLYPTALYMVGWMIWKPLAIQCGISFLCAACVFPESVSSQFRRRFTGVLNPLHDALGEIEDLFAEAGSSVRDGEHVENTDTDNREAKVQVWGDKSEKIRSTLMSSLPGVAPLQAQQRYLSVDISYGRLSGKDLKVINDLLASMQVRAAGMTFFFNAIVNKVRHSHLDSVSFSAHDAATSLSRPGSRAGSRPPSRPSSRPPSRTASRASMTDISNRPSVDGTISDDESHREKRRGSRSRRGSQTEESQHSHHGHGHDSFAHHLLHAFQRSHSSFHLPGHHSRKGSATGLPGQKGSQTGLHGHKGSHMSLLDSLRKLPQPVGVYESQRYMDLERDDERDLERMVVQLEVLSHGALPLVKALKGAMASSVTWCKTSDRKRHEQLRDVRKAYGVLGVMLSEFKDHRTEVTKPYRHLFDPSQPPSSTPPTQHKGLYYCFVAQYTLVEFTEALLKFMSRIIEVDDKRQQRRLWFPNPMSLFGQFRQSMQQATDNNHEEQGGEEEELEDDDEYDQGVLGEARRRNPDYRPFKSPVLIILSKLSVLPDILTSRSAMFAIKAGSLSCLTTLPAYVASSASFYSMNRGVWCTIMAQMTLAVFSGDTFNSWLARTEATFGGIVAGLAVWYIGAGHGSGNPFGVGAVTAVVFPLAMFYRLYYPAPVLTTVVFTTSIMLVIGYSWQNGNVGMQGNATWGWSVAWRRFVCVFIGVTAAWIWSVVPPAFSAKRAIRTSYALAITATGRILCEILSDANDPHNHTDMGHNQRIRGELLRARAKLTKLGVRHANAKKEFSLRGRWPEERYQGLLTTLVETMSLLAQFNHLLPQLDSRWRRALLARTRMSDPLFLGDVLAVISMTSSALKTAAPLPQITPGPLIAKYHMNKYKGLDLPMDPAQQDEDLPALVTVDVLDSVEYMRYALGVTTVYALMARLDAIVAACKTLLGETFHISNMRFEEHLSMA